MPELGIEIEYAIEQRKNPVDQISTPVVERSQALLVHFAVAGRAHRPFVPCVPFFGQSNVATLKGHEQFPAEKTGHSQIERGKSAEDLTKRCVSGKREAWRKEGLPKVEMQDVIAPLAG